MFCLPALLLLLQDQSAFRTDVTLVHVDAEVRQAEAPRRGAGQEGRAVTDLGKESFVVTDGGKPQPILHFGHQTEPLDLVLLLDVSSETRPAIRRVVEAAHTVVSELHEGDRLAVMVLETCETRLVADLSTGFDTAEPRLQGEITQRNSGVTGCQILTGIRSAAQHFLREPRSGRRRSIIVITDDKALGTAPRLVHDTVADLWESDAVVLGVIVHSGNTAFSIGPPHRGARYAAEITGGDTLNRDDAVEGLREMIQRLHQRYSLDYAMPPGRPGEVRRIRLTLAPETTKRHPRAQVLARSGYVVPATVE